MICLFCQRSQLLIVSGTYSEIYISGGELSPLTAGINCPAEDLADLAREVLGRKCALRFRARGISMLPLIEDGDIVFVNAFEAGEARLGDIILIQNQSGVVKIHRVIGHTISSGRGMLITKGDNTEFPDELFLPAQALGRVYRVEKKEKIIDLTRRDYRWAAFVLGASERARLTAARRSGTEYRKTHNKPGVYAVCRFAYYLATLNSNLLKRYPVAFQAGKRKADSGISD